MSLMNSTGDRLRRATQLWHAYLAATGQRFELAQFLKDPALEKQVLDGALASGDAKLIALAQDWLRDTGQAVPAAAARAAPRLPRPRIPPKPRSRRATCAVFDNWRFRATPKKTPRKCAAFSLSKKLKSLTSRSSDGTSGRSSRWWHHSRTARPGRQPEPGWQHSAHRWRSMKPTAQRHSPHQPSSWRQRDPH